MLYTIRPDLRVQLWQRRHCDTTTRLATDLIYPANLIYFLTAEPCMPAYPRSGISTSHARSASESAFPMSRQNSESLINSSSPHSLSCRHWHHLEDWLGHSCGNMARSCLSIDQQHIPQQPGGDILVPVNPVGVHTFDLSPGRR